MIPRRFYLVAKQGEDKRHNILRWRAAWNISRSYLCERNTRVSLAQLNKR